MQPYKIGDKLKCLNVTMSRHYIERNWAVCAGLNVGDVYTVEKDSIDCNWVYIEDTPYALSSEHFELIKQEYKTMKVTIEVTQEYINNLVQADIDKTILNLIETDVQESTVKAYRKAYERLWNIEPNWTDSNQSKWALVLDIDGIKAVEAFTGYRYPIIFPTRVDALSFVDDAGYDAVERFLESLESEACV